MIQYDIKQINFLNIPPLEKEVKEITLPDGTKENHEYAIYPLEENVVKIGYSCHYMSIQYPIFITVNDEERKIEIDKTGIYEFQNENFGKDKEELISVNITQIKIPVGIDCVFDYVLGVVID